MTYQPPPPLPIEFALAVECCRRAFSGVEGPELHRLAERVDWDRFLAVCRRHRVQGLAWHGLNSLDLSFPGHVRDALSNDAQSIAEQGLRAAAESLALLKAFEGADIPLLFVKGLTLGKLAYGNPFLKMGWDLDLLVSPDQVVAAARELVRIGYELADPSVPFTPERLERWHRSSKESAWRKPDGTIVELHSRLADNPRLIPKIDASSPRQLVEVVPGIRLPTLAGPELFAYLCVHGASSAWFRLKWITDLAALLDRLSAEEIASLHDRSQQLGAGRAAAQALLLANRLYGTPIDAALRGDWANRWLASAAFAQMTGRSGLLEPTERPLGTATIHLSQFLLLPGIPFKLSELARQARTAIVNRLP